MKKFFATIAILAVSYAAEAQALINNESLTREKSVVTISFKVESQKSRISSKMKEVIKPYLFNGADTLWLNEVAVYGKGRFLRERQVSHINGNKTWTLSENQVMKGSECNFSQQVEVKGWMRNAQLGVRREIEGCGKCGIFSSEENIAKAELFVVPKFELEDVSSHQFAEQENLEVIFKVSKIEIDHTVYNNEVTFNKILAAVDKIYGNVDCKVEKIVISGYASPEGSVKFNTWLGENRAKALIDYIIGQRPEYKLTYDNFEVVNGEENWGGLREVLEQSNIRHKDEVIAIIDDESLSSEAKKRKIKALGRGQVWRSMIRELHSQLRSAQYKSISYIAANDEFMAIINKANALIREERYAEAYKLAITASRDARSYNTIGVALMGEGRLKEASEWFERAILDNNKAAKHNLEALVEDYGPQTK